QESAGAVAQRADPGRAYQGPPGGGALARRTQSLWAAQGPRPQGRQEVQEGRQGRGRRRGRRSCRRGRKEAWREERSCQEVTAFPPRRAGQEPGAARRIPSFAPALSPTSLPVLPKFSAPGFDQPS